MERAPTRPIRVFGHGRRDFGIINLKVDPTKFLDRTVVFSNVEEKKILHWKRLYDDIEDLSRTKQGDLVWSTLEYFEKSKDVITYVDTLITICMRSEHILDLTTKNFTLISNIVEFGESIKRQMFFNLNHLYDDLQHATGLEDGNDPHMLLKYYTRDTYYAFAKLVGLLFFRFRKHLYSNERFKLLAGPVIFGFNCLLHLGTLESFKLFTRLIQLNFHSLEEWEDESLTNLVNKVKELRGTFKQTDEEWVWLSGALDIIYQGPTLDKAIYDKYVDKLGYDEWAKHVALYPPVESLQEVNEFVVEEMSDRFHISPIDIKRNMFIFFP